MYQIYLPPPSLRLYVDCYWMLRADAGTSPNGVAENILVDGKSDLIFNFGAPYQRITPTGSQPIGTANFDGQREYPIQIAQNGTIHLVGIRFKPGGVSPFCPIPSFDLKNQVLDVDAIFGKEASFLEERLFAYLDNFTAQADELTRFLRQRLKVSANLELAQAISNEILVRHGQISLKSLSQHFAYSGRHLNRIYQQHVGFTPKFHARIERLHATIGTLLREPQLSHAELALKCGYYDQSHMLKEFHTFTGHTLSAYQALLEARRHEGPPPILVRFLQDE